MTEETLYKALISVAESRFQPLDWDCWWSGRTLALQKVLTPDEFRRLNIAPDEQHSYHWMLDCQREAEAILTARKVPFRHGNIYESYAAQEDSDGQN